MRLRYTLFTFLTALFLALAFHVRSAHAGTFTLSFTADGTSRWYDMISDAFGQLDKFGSGPGGGDGFFYATGYGQTFYNPNGIEEQFRPIGGGAVIFPYHENFSNIGTLTWNDTGLTGVGVETADITGLTLDFSKYVADNDALTSSGYSTHVHNLDGTVTLYNGAVASIDLTTGITFTYDAYMWGLGSVDFTGTFIINHDEFVLDVNDQSEGSPFIIEFWYGSSYPWSRWDVTGVVNGLATIPPPKSDQTITFDPLPDRIFSTDPVTLNATSSSELPVVFEVVSGPAVINGNQLILTGTGVVTVRAIQPGNDSFNPAASVTRSFTVSAATTAPAIITQPVSLTVTAGESAVFSVSATGLPAPSYQWRRNGTAISGAISATYTIGTTTTDHAGEYTVVVSNTSGSVTSAVATLTVQPAAVAPVITSQPVSLTLTEGEPAQFSVTASGKPVPTYQWRLNDTDIPGATDATYIITNTTLAQAGDYTVVVTNTAGSVTSTGATLTVNKKPVSPVPAIVTQPVSLSSFDGQSVTFSVEATGTPPPTYQWYFNGRAIRNATGATYTIPRTNRSHVGTYTVVVTNELGSVTSASTTFSRLVTTRLLVAGDTLTYTGTRTNLQARVTKDIDETITLLPGAKIDNGTWLYRRLSDTQTWTRYVTKVTQEDGSVVETLVDRRYVFTTATGGTYTESGYVIVTKDRHRVSAHNLRGNGTFTYTPNPEVTDRSSLTAPRITRHPVQRYIAEAGATLTFTGSASGSPAPVYQWQRNGVDIPGATGATYTVENIDGQHAGDYTLVATNLLGSATTRISRLQVNTAPRVLPDDATFHATGTRTILQTRTESAVNDSFTLQADGKLENGTWLTRRLRGNETWVRYIITVTLDDGSIETTTLERRYVFSTTGNGTYTETGHTIVTKDKRRVSVQHLRGSGTFTFGNT